MRKCTNCCRAPQPITEFQSEKDPTVFLKRCLKCREKDARNSKKPETRERKNALQRTKRYWVGYRAREREKDEEAFLARNARVHREWLAANPGYQHDYKQNSIGVHVSDAKSSAKKRSIGMHLTDERLRDLILGDCVYCGKESVPGDFNGIDRVRNQGDYEEGNVVSCCGVCNFMKGALDVRTFIDRCEHVAGAAEHPEAWPESRGVLTGVYEVYADRARMKGLEFALNEADFKALCGAACAYCRRAAAGGVDRVDNECGYTAENCAPCCTECNYAKNAFSEEVFRGRCAAVAGRRSELAAFDVPVDERRLRVCARDLKARREAKARGDAEGSSSRVVQP